MTKRITWAWYVCFALIVCAYPLFAQYSVEVEETRSAGNETVLTFNLDDYTLSQTAVNDELCEFAYLPDAAYLDEKGLPMIPYVNRSIIIPNDAQMAVELVDISFKEVAVKKYLPSRGTILRSQNPAAIPYSFGSLYTANTWYPKMNTALGKPYILRNFRGIVVRFYPFQYNPALGILKVAESIKVVVKKVGPGRENVLASKPFEIAASYNTFYKNHFINYQQVKTRYDFIADGEAMAIIAPSKYKGAMEPLATWKNQKGIKTKVYEYPSETGGSGSSALKNFVKQKYTSDKIAYVLLVGDDTDIQPPSGGGGRSDPSLTQVSGSDRYPDLFVGRFCANSATKVQNMVNNALKYEKEPELNGSWYHKAIGHASSEGNPPDYRWMEDFRKVLMDYTFTVVDKVYQGQGGSTSQVINGINEGRSWLNYMGHGSSGSFGFSGARVSSSAFRSMTNTNKLPVIISVACNNGQFNRDCIGEIATTQKNIGALAFLGSWISQPWKPPQHGQKEMVRLIATEKCISLGSIVYNGTSKILDQSSSSSYVNTFLTWTLFGDPSLMIHTDKPKNLNATVPEVVGTGQQSVDVSFGESIDGRVCIYSEKSGVLGSKIVLKGTSASLSVNVDDDEEKLLCTITARNKMPLVKEIEVNSGPYLRVTEPVNGAEFWAGAKAKVTWKTGGGANVSNVKLEYSTDNGSSYKVIENSVANNNTYEWKVPDVNESDKCIVKVSATNGNLIGESGVFIIKQKAAIALNPSSLSARAPSGQSEKKTVKIENRGKGKLTYSIAVAGAGPKIVVNELYVSVDAFYDGLELWNRGTDQDMTGWKVEWKDNKNTSGSYEFKNGFTLKAGKTVVLMDQESSANDNTLFVGSNMYWDQGETELSVALLNPEGKGVDFVKSVGNNDNPPAGTKWSGAGVTLNQNYMFRKGNGDTDTKEDWTGGANGSPNALNPNQSNSGTGNWLTVSPKEGSVDGLKDVSITVTFNAAGLRDGDYKDTLIITHNSADINSPSRIPCTFTVGAIPIITNHITFSQFDLGYFGNRLVYKVPQKTQKSSHVKIGLYNLQGKLVQMLVDGQKSGGVYTVQFHGAKAVAAGMYLAKMEVADLKKSIKILVK